MNNFFEGKSVLVTGGTGFVGSHLVEKLVSKGAKVTVSYRDEVKAKKNLEAMSMKHPDVKKLFDCWKMWLNFPMEELINCCLDLSIFARDMRQVTPFAGLLSARERFEIITKFRKEEGR